MKKQYFYIDGIPSIYWGNPAEKIFILIHGVGSNKEEAELFAKIVETKGYGVISFDMPEHGERINEKNTLRPWNCIEEIEKVYRYAQSISPNISIFASSLGAYMSLLTFSEIKLEKALFLSPILDLQRLIRNLMSAHNITEAEIMEKGEIPTPAGITLYDEYYKYVMAHPITKWETPTEILYGEHDNLSEYKIVTDFADRFDCGLELMKNGEHWFHTEDQLAYFSDWVDKLIVG